jgi:hypothetical protein
LIIAAILSCSDDSTVNPDADLIFRDSIVFYYYECLDDSCKEYKRVITDTIDFGDTPRMYLTLAEELSEGDNLEFYLIDSKNDTIYMNFFKILPNEKKRYFELSAFRVRTRGIYYTSAFYIHEGVRKDLNTRFLVIR